MAGKPLHKVNPVQWLNLEHITVLEIEKGPPEWSIVTVWLSGQTTRWLGQAALDIMRAKGVVDAQGNLPADTTEHLLMKDIEIARAVPHPTLIDARQAQQQQDNGGPPPKPVS